ncbi:YhjD/YihY/BrkB family envelope integrity protein [Pseudonocardia sp. N23]|uniref:YhjD/YihY/BrkB family envelope integrity protein n=1 Tax=Pseudonocardia sp. N23 TaxID=1987376 RepID=UPI000C0365C4|nr:YhjD/YihY/BrkB family envelope integrity protein [Pseudonocardia sp. N23]GAY09760.1 putative membrane protein [Pseudonocardia sp. N23]
MDPRRWLADLRRRLPFADHLHRTGRRYVAQRGNHLASAVAFATVLAAVPLLMVLFAAAGFLLWARPDLVAELETFVVGGFPAPIAETLVPLVHSAVAGRVPVASVGFVAALWAGKTWIAVVREAVSAMWELAPHPPASPGRILRDLGSLLVLLVALSASVALTVSATGGLGAVLDLLGLADRATAGVLVGVVGLVLGWGIGWSVLVWLLGRLPGHRLPVRTVAPVAAAGALLVEAITVVTTLTIGATSGSVGGAVFGSLLAGLAFLFAAARVLLSLAAWLATADAAADAPSSRPPVNEEESR